MKSKSKSKSEQIYEAIGEGYGYNGSKEQCIEIIENIINSDCNHSYLAYYDRKRCTKCGHETESK